MFTNRDVRLQVEVPLRQEVLEGRDVTIASAQASPGDKAAPLTGNCYGFESTASLAAAVLFSSGSASEDDLVTAGLNRGLVETEDRAALSGGVSQEGLLRLLSDLGEPSRSERGYSLEDLAQNIESGLKIMALVNAGEWWGRVDDPSAIEPNWAVVVEGVVRDAHSQEIVGFLIRDSATPEKPSFVDAARMVHGWLDAGGCQIVRDRPSL